ncbi:MAG: PorT family protein [Prevotella sp.]|nr:PorT family protein [Prevotella sp.]
MMKRFSFLVAVLTVSLMTLAQPSAGSFSLIPRLGVNFANMTNDEVVVDLMQQEHTLKSRIKPGLMVGFDAEYQATSDLFMSLGLQYSRQGSRFPDFERKDGEFVEGYSDWHTDLDYLNVPLLFGYRIAKGFSVKAGLQLGLLLGGKEKMSYTDITILDGGTRKQGNAVPRETDVKDVYKSVDLSIPLALSYEFENVILDARYNFGLTRIHQLDAVKSRNSVIQLSVGYRFQVM